MRCNYKFTRDRRFRIDIKMEKIKYFFAAVYQSIKSRRPDGTPYFNLCLGITGILLLNIMDILLIFKIWGHIDFLAGSKNTFLVYFLSLAFIIFFLIKLVIPIDEIRDIDVDEKDVRVMNTLFFAYFMLSIAFLGVLLILSRASYPLAQQ